MPDSLGVRYAGLSNGWKQALPEISIDSFVHCWLFTGLSFTNYKFFATFEGLFGFLASLSVLYFTE